MRIGVGQRYRLFDAHLTVVLWRCEGVAWFLLHDAATDEPCYRICPNGDLERVQKEGDDHHGVLCDATVFDLSEANDEEAK